MKRSASPEVRTQCLGYRLLFVAMLMAIALVTSGCFSSITWVIDPGVYQLTGTVEFGPRGLLMDDVEVSLEGPSGPVLRTVADVDGRFSFSRVSGGTYTLTATSLAGIQSEKVYLYSNLNRTVTIDYPSWVGGQPFQEAAFLDISGLWYWDFNDRQDLQRFSWPNLRWPFGKTVSIFIDDGSGSGPGWPVPDSAWRNDVRNYVANYWRDLPVSPSWARTSEDSHLYIEWCPAKYLGEYVAAETVLRNTNGYVYKVTMTIDTRHKGLDQPVFAHELWHSLGVGHVNDKYSVMHPQITPFQTYPFCLADVQKDYLWLAYAIRPNQRVPVDPGKGVASVRAMKVAAAPAVETTLRRADGSSTTVQGVPEFLQKSPGVRRMLSEAKTQGQSGFLWDQIKIDDAR